MRTEGSSNNSNGVWEESLLADVAVRVVWAGRRDWQPHATLNRWTSDLLAFGIYLVQRGALEVVLAGQTWRVPAGEVLFVPAGITRERITAGPQGAQWLSLGLSAELYGRIHLTPLLTEARRWTPPPLLEQWMTGVMDVFPEESAPMSPLVVNHSPRDAVSRLIGDSLGRAILGLCWPALQSQTPTLQMLAAPPWLWRLLQQMHHEPQLSLAELSRTESVSPTHLRRTFHRYLGQSPQTYLAEQRLQRARHLLETTEQTVLSIATEVGFESLSHFTHLFRQRFTHSPARYRRLVQSGGLHNA